MTLTIDQLTFNTIMGLIKILVVFQALLIAVPLMVWWERKLIAWIQQRDGPTQVGPFGILQTLVDGGKLFLKEDIRPAMVETPLHTLAPILTVVPAFFAVSIVPMGPVISFELAQYAWNLGPLTVAFADGLYNIPLGITDLDIGILFYMAITGVGVYGIVLAGWASNSKYSLLGGIRSSAQLLSYEIALGLSMVGVLLIAGTFELRQIIADQQGGLWNWYFVKQPLAFLVFMTASFAETNRLPFDLPEGESELGAGFHTEYSSMKFSMFFMAEYINMFTGMSILTTLFLGGFHAPLPFLMLGEPGSVLFAISGIFWFLLKIFLLISFMIFIRGTLPRFRYDQLMDFGWKLLFPAALISLVVTALIMTFVPAINPTDTLPMGIGATVGLAVAGLIQIFGWDAYLSARKKKVLAHAYRPV